MNASCYSEKLISSETVGSYAVLSKLTAFSVVQSGAAIVVRMLTYAVRAAVARERRLLPRSLTG